MKNNGNNYYKYENENLIIGVVEWFHINDKKHVEEVIENLKKINVTHLRTGISWADWYSEDGKEWYAWLMPKLTKHFKILPCFTYTPPSLGIEYKTCSPPRNPKDYADFLDVFINEYGNSFEWVELWNEPNNLNDWDWRMDPTWQIFADMIVGASYWAKQLGKKTVLGGMAPSDPNWINLMCERNALENIDAISFHGFPGTWEFDWSDWNVNLKKVRDVLNAHGLKKDIWITEAGYSTWQHDDHRQLCEFVKVISADVSRVYWYSARDLHPDLPHQEGFHEDERHYHFGIKKSDGTPKLIYRIWEKDGLAGVRAMADICNTHIYEASGKDNKPATAAILRSAEKKPTLIIGGAGFIGTNLAERILMQGEKVLIFDNLSRPGVEENLKWLLSNFGNQVEVEIGDVRNPYIFKDVVKNVSSVYNFAAQVAVTTSLVDPVYDFEVNLRGAINLLEALRKLNNPPPLIFTSTNKVYGGLYDLGMEENNARYLPVDEFVRNNGVDEKRPLDFHSPYGCSKGGADQYILDYARSYGMKTAVFRMSCIYGPHQFGTEDQGWVAHFIIQAIKGNKITLFGDGKQVRDILFVHDLVDALLLARDNIAELKGEVFNIGGGVNNTISLLELLKMLEQLTGERIKVNFSKWRTGDQKYYVSNINKMNRATGWEPKVNVKSGIQRLYNWLNEYYNGKKKGTRSISAAYKRKEVAF
jgi:CDP-paratose 2-epimerase